ncbi:hypothetical protein SAMN05444414_14223 [Roseovarius marisflavi]|uniref:Uncharacterized protein n=1 Tax=Roseovarius marisflavi TaxID=1054996 RepID=A0A1M7DKT3_9RHOB|nr:hypothetical protein SAMN05444414_14223 [Roseovarius marisflavi]
MGGYSSKRLRKLYWVVHTMQNNYCGTFYDSFRHMQIGDVVFSFVNVLFVAKKDL